MTVPFSSKTTKEELKASLGDGYAVAEDGKLDEVSPETLAKLGNRNEKGQFGTGHRASVGNAGGRGNTGIVAFVKGQTNNYQDLLQFLVDVAKGKTITTGSKTHVPSFKDRLDATNSLLDRSIGKPTQQVYHTSDEETKQLMADRARLRVLEAERKAITRKPVIEHEPTKSISSIQAMRDGTKG